ncbi:MAG: NAD-dependent epimerase/dehydratase family protein, partial [Acetobacteraceae bacterium]
MRILITGAAGMIGRKLAASLAANGLGEQPVTALTLADVVAPAPPAGFTGAVAPVVADLAAPGAAAGLIGARPDLIFHLAAIVSGEAEA